MASRVRRLPGLLAHDGRQVVLLAPATATGGTEGGDTGGVDAPVPDAVYLMDEPLGTLDSDQRLAMRELIRTEQLASRVTTIYVTHDQEEAMSLADRVVVMSG